STSGGLLPTLTSGVWAFDYTTGILSIVSSGGGTTPTVLLWAGNSGDNWDRSGGWTNTGSNDTTWNNATNGVATIASFNTAGNVNIANAAKANGLDFQAGANGIILNGSAALTLNGPSVSLASGVTATINAQLSGTNGINVHGGGTLLLSSTLNNFSGGV